MEPALFKLREGQERVLEELLKGLEERKFVCLQAPAGYGKTLLTLIALGKFMKSRIRAVWSVRTGNETDRPIEEMKKLGMDLPAISFRGKRDMCLLAKQMKAKTYEGVEALCRLKKDKCPYYKALEGRSVKLTGPKTFTEIYIEAKREGVCPYYLQYNLLEKARIVSLSYNYVFTPVMWSIRRKFPFGRSVLIVDEAHNLQNLAYDLNSDYISTLTVSRAEKELKKLGEKLKLEELRRAIKDVEKTMAFGEAVFSPRELVKNAKLNEKKLTMLFYLGEAVQRLKVEEGKEPRSSLHHLAKFLLMALEKEGDEGIVFIATKEGKRTKLEMRDLRASEFLKEVWPNFYRVVLMSGTLRPVRAFAEITGIDDYHEVRGEWRYNYAKIRSFIVKGVNTKGEELTSEMKRKYVKVIRSIVRNLPENIAVFTSSYRVLEALKDELVDMEDRRIFIEEKGMSGRKASKMLKEFKKSRRDGLLLATCTGRFAEGADFPGETLRAVIIVGIPYDKPSLSTKLYISYFKKIYGAKGRYYAYILPAMRRVDQALGRVIREEGEGGLFILADERFRVKTNFRLLPKYIRATAKKIKVDQLNDAITEAYREVASN